MKTGNLLLVILLLTSFTFLSKAAHLRDNLLLTAKIDGAQQVPAVTTSAQGIASFMLNSTRDTMCVNISVTGLSGPITGIHIHEAGMGSNGPVILDLTPYVLGTRIATSFTGADISMANLSKFLDGKYYVNIHTTANPNGEIRGQIKLETDFSFAVTLSGSQEVPAVTTSAYGEGFFTLSKDQSKIKFNIVTQDLSGAITGAHLHNGAAGMAGGVIVDLSASIFGNVISGVIASPSAALIDSMMNSKIYVNVHTAANPNGEIRAQLINSANMLYFDASLDGSQEVPSVVTNAKGAANVNFNTTLDTLWYNAVIDGLSGLITGAHFHNAAVGAAGGVEIDLSSGINGKRISGMVTGTMLNTSLINKFMRGEIYLNVHTASNPNGEVRGQVYRTTREGYTFSLDGNQEVPPVSTAASGSGIVSIDRDQSNAHYMFVANGVTATGTHFHNGVMGQNGSVIYDLSAAFTNNGAYGYWRNTDSTPFMVANSVQFRNDGVYVNIHTAANPNGELRGQVKRGFTCYNLTTDIGFENTESISQLNVYPNPAHDIMYIAYHADANEEALIIISDIMGKEISRQTIISQQGNNKTNISLEKEDKGVYIAIVRTQNSQAAKIFFKK